MISEELVMSLTDPFPFQDAPALDPPTLEKTMDKLKIKDVSEVAINLPPLHTKDPQPKAGVLKLKHISTFKEYLQTTPSSEMSALCWMWRLSPG